MDAKLLAPEFIILPPAIRRPEHVLKDQRYFVEIMI
jgi:hypothetical protein